MPGGRPTVVDEVTLQKLEEAFSLGCTDLEACLFANISKSTLYNYQNEHPEFVERKEDLKEKPVLKARTAVVKSLDDPNHAFKYLERKKRKEFGQQLDINAEVTTKIISVDD